MGEFDWKGCAVIMMYAMILKNRVIDIKESETVPKYPPDAYGNDVTSVECSDDVTVGMIYDAETVSFSEPEPKEPEPKEPEPAQPTQLDRIEEQLNKSLDEIRAEGAAAASVNLMVVGAEMTKAMSKAKMDVPATAGTFADEWDEWTADEKTADAKSLWKYKGVGYQARTDIQKIEVYAPDVATNKYAVRPIPDVNGIFPGMLNMDVSIGMKVRDWEDGKVYICYANPITSLQWAPHTVAASFKLYEG